MLTWWIFSLLCRYVVFVILLDKFWLFFIHLWFFIAPLVASPLFYLYISWAKFSICQFIFIRIQTERKKNTYRVLCLLFSTIDKISFWCPTRPSVSKNIYKRLALSLEHILSVELLHKIIRENISYEV